MRNKYTTKDIYECIGDIGQAESTIFTISEMTQMVVDASTGTD
jgi:hypothetical protein